MSISLTDQEQRAQALNTQRSFIVQAPAGSGKTELLVQRYLALLCESATPEAILALTFTQKAAAEMRQRVLDTLQFAASASFPLHESYQNTRWKLGQKLYQWQMRNKWDLLRRPDRLKIQTIDSFYAQLTRKAPLHSRLTATTKILEDPTPLYQAAIQQLLTEREEESQLGHAVERLAEHLNNDTLRIEKLLMHMLAHRDQWTNIIPQDVDAMQKLRVSLEACLQQVCHSVYQKAEQTFAHCGIEDWRQQLQFLVNAIYCSSDTESTVSLSSNQFWKSAAELLLTKQGEWRKVVAHSGIKNHPAPLQKSLKDLLKKWLATLKSKDSLRLTLCDVRQLPPAYYTDSEWSLLSDLFYMLNALLAILNLMFEQQNQMDYIAIALKASQLLGNAEDPTDLLLSLDYRIQHILLDEFQDTSLQQLRFLNRLTEGWQPKDGRTLFLVGDPMQSIYRFRKAESRLFQLVQQTGLGACELESIKLSTNFRAVPKLIKWMNHHFKSMGFLLQKQFTQESLLQPSVALEDSALHNCSDEPVKLHWLSHATPEQELEQMINCVKAALQAKTDEVSQSPSIAILGRTRQHLLPILSRLRVENIPYQAVDIETLGDKPIIKDLLALTRALTHLGDNVAWLALLRAPWCGLCLSDLYYLMQACQKKSPTRLIWDQLHQLDDVILHQDSKNRLAHFLKVMEPAVDSYGRASLKERVAETFHRLNGPFTQLTHAQNRKDVECFLDCIEELQVGETLTDVSVLESKLNATYTTTKEVEGGQVTLMTIHKAKGLEFDIVMIPNLHKSTRSQNHSLILFDEFPALKGNHLLLAPIKASDTAEDDPIYRYLRQRDIQQHHAETLRLFYVACTRAKKELHLFASLQHNESGEILTPSRDTFLYWLWPTLTDDQKQLIACTTQVTEERTIKRALKRMIVKDNAD